MARKPKIQPGATAETAMPVAEPVAADAAPAPVRRGRKPKQPAGPAAASASQVDDAAGGGPPNRTPTPAAQLLKRRSPLLKWMRPLRRGRRRGGTGTPAWCVSTGPRSSGRLHKKGRTRVWPSCWSPPARRAPTRAGRCRPRIVAMRQRGRRRAGPVALEPSAGPARLKHRQLQPLISALPASRWRVRSRRPAR